ncbi:MAG: Na+:solute symporter [Acidobacteria bacterium]|nr:Na+:solute symporter [Acidobacteriota bacterium]MBU4494596.1 Na+:solute symporter [Acidobacteriota bacterium]
MILHSVDWVFIIGFFILSLAIGLAVSRRAGKNASEFFLSGRNMPWWLLGVSMVATTFSSDTPNLVTDIVRQNGVSGNWVWWAFLLTGMLTVFVYAKLWRRSKVMTDLGFYELRYSGKAAAFLRGFRALYLGVFFNVLIMAAVSLAMIKIGGVMLKLTPVETLLIASTITVAYSALGGLRGVLITDFFQFGIAMAGAVAAAIVAVRLPQVGGLKALLTSDALATKLNLLPDFSDTGALLTLFILPLAVQWWSVWYPGAEPGGGGYIAQRMLSAKSEKHATGATLLFNATHYALRPWPWIVVALCSLLVFPDLESLRAAFPHIDPGVIRHDLAYPAMLTFLPRGLLGLVVASLMAAFMSTISTHLNWGSSYVVNDFYKRFINPGADERSQVLVGRISTVVLMVLAGLLALLLSNALQAFNILLQIGAGTGLLFILRWFWWRINPVSEITAMGVSFVIAIYFQFIHPLTGLPAIATPVQLVTGVSLTTISWILVTLLTKPSDKHTLRSFYSLVRPGGPGWKKVLEEAEKDGEPVDADGEGWDVPAGIVCMALGCLAVYSALFATGNFIYGKILLGAVLASVALISTYLLTKAWKKLRLLN